MGDLTACANWCNVSVAMAFHPHDSAFNRTNALYLAHASDIAYHRAPAAAARSGWGWKRSRFATSHAHARVSGRVRHACRAGFRGSDPVTLQTWLTDAIVRLGPARGIRRPRPSWVQFRT